MGCDNYAHHLSSDLRLWATIQQGRRSLIRSQSLWAHQWGVGPEVPPFDQLPEGGSQATLWAGLPHKHGSECEMIGEL
jgi:hypothetical protein